jgi:hypothetical protein
MASARQADARNAKSKGGCNVHSLTGRATADCVHAGGQEQTTGSIIVGFALKRILATAA